MPVREVLRVERHNATVLAEQLRSFHPDVVMWWAMGGMSLSLLEQVRRAEVPALAVVGDDWIIYGPLVDPWIRQWRTGPGRFAAGAAARLVNVPTQLGLDRAAQWSFVSEYVLGTARSAGWRLERATVDHPGVDPARFAFSEPPQAWGWRLLYCGRIDPRKGVSTAVRALARLPEQARLAIVGDGDQAEISRLKALAAQLGVADRVEFGRSEPEDVPAVYAQSDAVLFPVTWHEPWGLVPLEAMAVGRPLVATRAGGGPAEYLETGRNCLQFEPSDDAGLAGVVQRLSGDHQLRAGLTARGRATAERFTAERYHRALERRLADAVAGGPRP
jgi:glycosyltransferase involved in cell wall biosynthesis